MRGWKISFQRKTCRFQVKSTFSLCYLDYSRVNQQKCGKPMVFPGKLSTHGWFSAFVCEFTQGQVTFLAELSTFCAWIGASAANFDEDSRLGETGRGSSTCHWYVPWSTIDEGEFDGLLHVITGWFLMISSWFLVIWQGFMIWGYSSMLFG